MAARLGTTWREPKSSSLSAATAAPLPQAVREFGGPGLVGVRVQVARMQGAPPPPPPSPVHSVLFVVLSSARPPDSPAR